MRSTKKMACAEGHGGIERKSERLTTGLSLGPVGVPMLIDTQSTEMDKDSETHRERWRDRETESQWETHREKEMERES